MWICKGSIGTSGALVLEPIDATDEVLLQLGRFTLNGTLNDIELAEEGIVVLPKGMVVQGMRGEKVVPHLEGEQYNWWVCPGFGTGTHGPQLKVNIEGKTFFLWSAGDREIEEQPQVALQEAFEVKFFSVFVAEGHIDTDNYNSPEPASELDTMELSIISAAILQGKAVRRVVCLTQPEDDLIVEGLEQLCLTLFLLEPGVEFTVSSKDPGVPARKFMLAPSKKRIVGK